MSKSIFKVTFDESLRLDEDDFSNGFVKKTTDDAIKKQSKKKKPIKYFLSNLLKLVMMVLSNYLIVFVNDLFVKHFHEENGGFNLLPYSLFYFFLVVWLSLIIFGRFFIKEKFLLMYLSQFHYAITYLSWFLIEANLFILTIYYPYIGIMGILVYILFGSIIGILLVIYRVTTLRKLLFKLKLDKFDKLIISTKKILEKDIPTLIIGYFIIKSILTIFHIQLPSTSKEIFLICFLIGMLGCLALQLFMFFPFFLKGYYKYKYPEEYRVLNKQTKEEWYGKKYLNKLAKKDQKKSS